MMILVGLPCFRCGIFENRVSWPLILYAHMIFFFKYHFKATVVFKLITAINTLGPSNK